MIATVTVRNLMIQFDSNDCTDENVLEKTQAMIDAINDICQVHFANGQPQIFTSGIDNSDITFETIDGFDV